MLIHAKRETNILYRNKVLVNSPLAGGRPVGYLHSAGEVLI